MLLPRWILALALGSVFLSSARVPLVAAELPATSGIAPAQEGKLEELRKLRRERRQKESEIESLKKGDAEARRKARVLQGESEVLAKAIGGLVPDVIQGLLKELKGETPESASKATARLAEVGSPAVPELEALATSGAPEERARAAGVLKLIKEVEAGDSGLWKQWAASARASSEYDGGGRNGEDDWSASQVCGKPDTDVDGDQPTAWASQEADAGEEWLELTYKAPVRPTRVRVRESFNPGAVVKIEAQDPEKKWQILWKGKDTTTESPGYLDISCGPPAFATRVLRITLDSASVPGWNEIDAVQLIGEPVGVAGATPPKGNEREPGGRSSGRRGPSEACVLLKRQLLEGPGAFDAFIKEHDSMSRPELRKRVTERLRALRDASRGELEPFFKAHPDLEVGEWLSVVNAFQAKGTKEELDLLAKEAAVKLVLPAGAPVGLFRKLKRSEATAEKETMPAVQEAPLDLKDLEVPWNLKDIGAEKCWTELGITGKGIVYAVIDPSPLCYTTAALKNAMWVNEREKPGNGVDDDGNGFVDDVHGWFFPKDRGDLLTNGQSHMLLCAGIIAGREADGMITGVAPRAKLMALSVDPGGYFSALQYALDHGADVVSMSFNFRASEPPPDVRRLWVHVQEQAICAGMVLAGGAGNDGANGIGSPKDVPGLIVTSGVKKNLACPPYSSRGPMKNADGVEIKKPDFCAFPEGYPMLGPTGVMRKNQIQGNSFSGPHAAAIAGLILEANPDMNPWQVKQLMCDTARDLMEPGWDGATGYGLLDAFAAVKKAQESRAKSKK